MSVCLCWCLSAHLHISKKHISKLQLSLLLAIITLCTFHFCEWRHLHFQGCGPRRHLRQKSLALASSCLCLDAVTVQATYLSNWGEPTKNWKAAISRYSIASGSPLGGHRICHGSWKMGKGRLACFSPKCRALSRVELFGDDNAPNEGIITFWAKIWINFPISPKNTGRGEESNPGISHTHTHPFNGPFSGTTRVSRYQKGKNQPGFYWSKRQWVAVVSAGQYASLHLAPDR